MTAALLLMLANPEPVAEEYVLVYWQIETVDQCSDAFMYCPGEEPVIRYKGFDSPKSAAEWLTERWKETSFRQPQPLGLYKLSDSTKVELTKKEIRHSKKVRVVDDGWTEHHWESHE